MALEDVPRLGCGRSIDRIWTTVNQPPSPHEKTCEQCQAARARLQRLSAATRSLRESDLHDAALKPRSSVKTAIMNVARAEVRRGRRILLYSKENGTTEISELALGSVIRFAATAIPGVHARRCRIEIHSVARDSSGNEHASGNPSVVDAHLIVSLRVAAASDIDIPQTVERLRQRIGTAISAAVGISAGPINITVEDLYDV